MTDITIEQGTTLTIKLPGLTAVRIDTGRRIVAIDHISGSNYGPHADLGPAEPAFTVHDLRNGTYGDFHRLKPAPDCFDPEGCADAPAVPARGHLEFSPADPCSDCGTPIPLGAAAYAIDCGGVCAACAARRYGDRAGEYLIGGE